MALPGTNALSMADKREMGYYIRNSWSISWPMIMIMLFDFLINLTDVYIAGRIGKEVQASVGFVSQMYFILVVIANAITVGTVSVLSRYTESQNGRGISSAIYTVMTTTVAAGCVLGLIGIFFAPLIIKSLKVPEVIKEYGVPLIRIYSAGLIFHYFLINSNGILRSRRMIKHSLTTMAVVSALNIILNFALVFYTSLGFRGIALATAMSVAAGCAINIAHLKKLFTRGCAYSIQVLRKVASIGWPSGILMVAWQIGSAVLFIILGKLPDKNIETIAAFTNGLRIEAAIFLPAFALNMANAVIVGNLLGEKRRDRAFKGGIVTALIGVVLITILTASVILNARPLSMFLSGNTDVIEESTRYLYISMISEPFMAWAVILGGGLNGAGDTRGVMRIVIFSQWAVRLPLSYIAGIYFELGATAVWWSMNTSIMVHAVFITIRYFRGKWLEHE
jgi:putative MATE family efflux protein